MNPLFALALVLVVPTTVYQTFVEGCGGCPSGGGPSKYIDVALGSPYLDHAESRSMPRLSFKSTEKWKEKIRWTNI